jgi:hypothetical protein
MSTIKSPDSPDPRYTTEKGINKYDKTRAEEWVRAGKIPPPPDFSADTHRNYRRLLGEVVKLANQGDLDGLRRKQREIEPKSSSRKVILEHVHRCVRALERAGPPLQPQPRTIERDLSERPGDAQVPQPTYIEASAAKTFRIPEEIPADHAFAEGAVTQVLVNRYERDPAARQRCIEHYGAKCDACGVILSDRYGACVDGLIHVHHLIPLATIRMRYSVDPVRDLRPVCPNCHAVIHSTEPARTIEQVREMIRKQNGPT